MKMHFELGGQGLEEQFTHMAGEFEIALKENTRKNVLNWLYNVMPDITAAAQDLCPYGRGDCDISPTGHLRDSIHWEVYEDELAGYSGSLCPYALWVEIGAQGRAGKYYLLQGMFQVLGGGVI